MDKKLAGALLALLIIVIGGLRLTFALSTPYLAWDGYDELRLTTHIIEHGLPLFEDELSYLGRERAYSPLYYYLLTPFVGANPLIALKTIPNILYVTSILLIYLIAVEISKSRGASLIAAGIAGFTPITFTQYLNDASPYTLTIPLLLVTIYALLKPKERLTLLIASSVLLSLTSPLVFLLIAGIALFLVIGAIEKINIDSSYAETLFFLLFFGLWSTLIFYKDAFFQQGFNVVWAYIPESVINQYFAEFTLVGIVAIIGALPLTFGGYTAYHALFRRRAHRTLLVVSISFATLGALLLRLLPPRVGFSILTILLSILAAQGLADLSRFFKKTKFPYLRYSVTGVLLFFFVFASIFPALSQAAAELDNTPTDEHIAAAEFLATQEASILAAPNEGFFFQYQAGTPTLTDERFLLAEQANELYEETTSIYRSRFALPALERLNTNSITHVVFSDEARQAYARNQLEFLPNDCFENVFEEASITIYEVRCNVRTE